MCGNCEHPPPEGMYEDTPPPVEFAEVDPKELFSRLGMAQEAAFQQNEDTKDKAMRLACLELAVRVKGEQGDSRKVLSSANSYYDFVSGKNKAADVSEDVNIG